jgi:hypothetical protein
MKKKIIGIFVIILLIGAAIIPVVGIGKTSNIDKYEPSLNKPTQINNKLNIRINSTENSISDNLNVAVDSSSSGEIACLNDGYEIYEGLNWKLYVTAYWDPPQEKYICLWADTGTLPTGATFDPCNCAIDSVTSTFEWTPSIGQAGTYYITFYVGESCFEPMGYFTITVVVYPLELEPQQTYEIYAGSEWHLELTAYWVPPQPSKLICLWVDVTTLPNGATFTPCHCDYGEVISDLFWTPNLDQIGEHIIVPLIGDTCGYYIYPWPIEVIVFPPIEGLHIDSKFQPVQVSYQHDIEYPPDDLTGGPCEYNAGLGMVAGKNTYLFGWPYNHGYHRYLIKMTCCNNYNVAVTFQWVLKIFPDGKEIWRSKNETVPAKTSMTFNYIAPSECPGKPFQWERWNDNAKTKKGYIELSIDPDFTGGFSDCNCKKIKVNVTLHKTHDLKVLYVPFTFSDGPEFPDDLKTPLKITSFDTWRLFEHEPWWNAIFPVREHGLDTDYYFNIKQDVTINGKVINNLTELRKLSVPELNKFQDIMLNNVLALSWIGGGNPPFGTGGWDRIVLLVNEYVISKTGGPTGCAYRVNNPNSGQLKQGVWIDWDAREKNTAAHEVGHTYGLVDSYKAGQKNISIGYWVNKPEDIESKKDVMWYLASLSDTWIKKPNYRDLLNRFTNHRDPKVLGISGVANKYDNIELNPWYKLDEGNVDLEWNTQGDYIIKGYDSNNNLIANTGFNVSFIRQNDEGEINTNQAIFAFRLEYINDLTRIDIVNSTSGAILATKTASINTPEITIISPSQGEKIKQEPFELKWEGEDADGDTLTYNLFLSNDSGDSWFPISCSIQQNSFSYDFSNLPTGNYGFKVFVTDGFNTAEETSDFGIKFNIKNIFFENEYKIKPKNNPINSNLFVKSLEDHRILFFLLKDLILN